jgi:hypothetical protein
VCVMPARRVHLKVGMVEVLQAKQWLQRCPACTRMAFTSCCHGVASNADEVSYQDRYVSRLSTMLQQSVAASTRGAWLECALLYYRSEGAAS